MRSVRSLLFGDGDRGRKPHITDDERRRGKGDEVAKDRLGALLLALVILGASGLQAWWIATDDTPFPYGDSYAYLTRLLQSLHRAENGGVGSVWGFLVDVSHAGRPPLYQLLTVPVVWTLGRSEDAVLAVNLVLGAIALISVYWSTRLLSGRKAALVAALLMASFPPLVGLQRMYWMHAVVPACSALSLASLMVLLERRSPMAALAFGATLGFGLLMHPSFAWFWAVPAVVFGAALLLSGASPRRPASLGATPLWILSRMRSRLFLLGLAPGALIALGLAAPWYLTAGWGLIEARRRMAASSLSSFRGYETKAIGFPEVANNSLWFAATAPQVLTYGIALACLGGLLHALARPSHNRLVAPVCLLSGYVFYGVFFPIKDWYHFAPILPFVAVLAVSWIPALPRRGMRALGFSAVSASALFSLYLTSQTLPPRLKPLAIALGAPLDSVVCRWPRPLAVCPHPPSRAADEQRRGRFPTADGEARLLARIVDTAPCRGASGCHLMIVRRTADMLPTRLTYLLARDWPDANVRVSDDSSHIWGYPYPVDHLLGSDYLVYSDLDAPDRDLYQKATLALLRDPPPGFATSHRRVAAIELTGGYTATILERTEPLTLDEAQETIEALELELDEQYTFLKYALLGSLCEKAGRLNEALAYYEEGLGRRELTASSKRELEYRRSLVRGEIRPHGTTQSPSP